MVCALSFVVSHLIGRDTTNIPEISSGVHGFMGKTVMWDVNQSVGFNSRYSLDDVVHDCVSILTPFLLDCFSIYNEETHWHKFSYAEGFSQEQVFCE